jgi:hypothetical protein
MGPAALIVLLADVGVGAWVTPGIISGGTSMANTGTVEPVADCVKCWQVAI